jgi:hypothetical protein
LGDGERQESAGTIQHADIQPAAGGAAQNYFLRLYDNSAPQRYSRYAAALHVDYPL